MPTKQELDDLEIQIYFESYELARENIVDSISKLNKRNRRADSPGEVAENDEKILDLTAEKALLDAKKAAFVANRHTITPPSPEQIQTLKDLITKVEELNSNEKILEQLVHLSTKALATFNDIHPNQG